MTAFVAKDQVGRLDELGKAKNRSRSHLVREALDLYFRFVDATAAATQ